MQFIDSKINECKERLAQIAHQIEALRREAASVEGALHAYESVKANAVPPPARIRERTRIPAPNSQSEPPTATSQERVAGSRLSPVWQAVFEEVLSAYPRKFSDQDIRAIAVKHGYEINESFRTALWHHQKRGNLKRDFSDGTYIATPRTAERAGIRWPGGDPGQ